mmetsp:Transcript_14449/g.18955  ORF Transcript_14449/g.18955 Transcript_14449/m.18955 type:complete len:211 (+) Transcript_14449:4727-5359(+)
MIYKTRYAALLCGINVFPSIQLHKIYSLWLSFLHVFLVFHFSLIHPLLVNHIANVFNDKFSFPDVLLYKQAPAFFSSLKYFQWGILLKLKPSILAPFPSWAGFWTLHAHGKVDAPIVITTRPVLHFWDAAAIGGRGTAGLPVSVVVLLNRFILLLPFGFVFLVLHYPLVQLSLRIHYCFLEIFKFIYVRKYYWWNFKASNLQFFILCVAV